jgi:predicted phage tail protein
MPGFAGTQQEIAVGVKLLQVSGKLIRSVPDAGADSVRVTVAVNSLIQTSNDGKVTGAKVIYKISVRVAGGSWTVAKEDTIDGKTGSRYQRATEVQLSPLGPGPYEVAVERVTIDSGSSLLQDDLYWDSYAIINYEQFTYPNCALFGIELDARYFSQIPTRRYHVQGLRVRVPKNYDPVSRRYATTGPGTTLGAWDGTTTWSRTDATALVVESLIRRSASGRFTRSDSIATS